VSHDYIPKEVFEETLLQFFEPIRPFLEDPAVSDIMINGPNQIYVEKKGQLHLTGAKFETREALVAALRNAAQFVGKHIDELKPILEGRLPDGSRIEAIIPPAAPDGPCVSIRRFFKETLTVQRLIGFGAMTECTDGFSSAWSPSAMERARLSDGTEQAQTLKS